MTYIKIFLQNQHNNNGNIHWKKKKEWKVTVDGLTKSNISLIEYLKNIKKYKIKSTRNPFVCSLKNQKKSYN